MSGLVAGGTRAGVDVTPDRALQLSAVYACVRVLAETLASLPLITYQEQKPRGKRRAADHPYYRLLHDIANPEMSSFEFRETLMGHVALRGNGYAHKQFNRAGQVMALWPLHPDRVSPLRKDDGSLAYEHRPVKGPAKIYDEVEIFHVRGLSSNGVVGLNPIAMQRESLGESVAMQEYGGAFYGNDATPGGILEHPGKLGDDAHKRLRESWEKRHQGAGNRRKLAILEEGMKYHQITVSPEDAQYLETRKFKVSDIARIFLVPPHMIMDLERATFSNIENQSIGFVVFTMRPWLVRWEQALVRSLFGVGDYRAEFLVDGLLRGDSQSRNASYAVGRQWGWLSANDVREFDNQNPIAGGDTYLVPMNMVTTQSRDGLPVTSVEYREQGRGGEGETRRRGDAERRDAAGVRRHGLGQAHLPVYREALGRILRREANDIGAAAKKWLGKRDVPQFKMWLDEFYREHFEFVRQAMMPVTETYGALVTAEVGQELDQTVEEPRRFVESYVGTYAVRHVARNQARIEEIIFNQDDTEPLVTLEAELESWRTERPERLAREEVTRANNAIARAAYLALGVLLLRWVTFGDTCPYCRSLAGKTVGINEFFLAGGQDYHPDGAERPLRPRGNVGHPPAHDGCDCLIMAGV